MAKPVKAVEEVELEEAEEAEEATTSKKGAEEEVWGVRNLIALIKEKTEKEYNPREVRTLLRKMAREGGGVDREIIPGNKSRYSWPAGAADPEVKAIIKAVKSGAIEASKKAALDKLKSDKAAKNAAKAAAEAKAAPKAKAAAPVADDDEED